MTTTESSTSPDERFDYDWIVIGSGFGGSVAALRLAEKGYRVGVLECGRRFRDQDFAKSTWDLRNYFWMPKLGLRGIFRMTPMKDVFIGSGSGVGGGSLGYASTLYRASPRFYEDPQWAEMDDWRERLAPHFDESERMLGVATVDHVGDGDRLLRELGAHFGVEETFTPTRVGIFLGEPGKTVADPYFDGEGPERRGCIYCGACMVGCRHGAKNTLVKNYLWFAERRGAVIEPERLAVDIRPRSAGDGADGYLVTSERPGAWLKKERRVQSARGVVVAAGTLGTNLLLANCKHRRSLPRLSDRLGELVRTNGESILAVTTSDDTYDFSRSVAISSSIHPSPDTHVELVTYGGKGDSMSFLFTLLTGKGTAWTRPFQWLRAAIRHPKRFLRTLSPFRWSRRTLIVLIMQTLDNAICFRPKPRLWGGGVRLTTEQDPEKPVPTYIEAADASARWLEERLDGVAQGVVLDALLNIPSTAHILGGAPIGADPAQGVLDANLRTYGYQNLVVCDGSAMPANPGVNPSLTITALAEHAMEQIPLCEKTDSDL